MAASRQRSLITAHHFVELCSADAVFCANQVGIASLDHLMDGLEGIQHTFSRSDGVIFHSVSLSILALKPISAPRGAAGVILNSLRRISQKARLWCDENRTFWQPFDLLDVKRKNEVSFIRVVVI